MFIDRQELDVGAAWQLKLFMSLERSKWVVPLLTDNYAASKPCLEEHSLAWQHGDEIGRQVLRPVYLRSSATMPTFLTFHQYLDAREEDTSPREAARAIIRAT